MGKIKDSLQSIKSTWNESDTGEKFNIAFGVTDVISGAISLFVLAKTFIGKDKKENED